MNILAWYDNYVGQGIQPIPLYPQSKAPFMKKWNIFWDEEYVRSILAKKRNSNIGIKLGSIMDVEGDTPSANRRLLRITKNCPHPMYSSSKSIHHLFLNPNPSAGILKFEGIEFRGKNCQSVLPPSHHSNGEKYIWLPQSRFPIPKMPKSVLELFKLAQRASDKKPGSKEINCHNCNYDFSLHYKRLRLEVKAFRILKQKWQCHKCRTVDIRPLCRVIRKK